MSPPTLQRFWLALECLAGQAAVDEEWRLCLGQEYDAASQLLRPTGELGAYFPRASPLSRRYQTPRRVTKSRDGTLSVLVGGTPIVVRPEQLAMLELHRERLALHLSQALGFQVSRETTVLPPDTARIGELLPSAGLRYPVFLACPRAPGAMHQSVAAISALERRPFLLLTPTRRLCGRAVNALLQSSGASHFPLAESVVQDAGGAWHMTELAQGEHRRFLERHAPASQKAAPRLHFPTPGGAGWHEVRMRFLDGETLSVQIRDVSGVVNYTEMGMRDRRNGRPTHQWQLLRLFADRHGTLDWSSRAAHRNHQKQKEVLSRRLKAFFRIDQEPFAVEGDGWRTRFALVSDL